MTEEEIFEKRSLKITNFKKELKELAKKYNFGKKESDNYDGSDNYIGTTNYFIVDDEPWYGESISEILDEVF